MYRFHKTFVSDSISSVEAFDIARTLTENGFYAIDSKYTDKVEGIWGRVSGSVANYSRCYICEIFADKLPYGDFERCIVVKFHYESLHESGEWFADKEEAYNKALTLDEFIERYGHKERA